MRLRDFFTGGSTPSRQPALTASDANDGLQGTTGLIDRWQRVLDVNPSDRNARLQLLEAYAQSEQWDRVDELVKSLEQDYPDDYQVRVCLARTLQKRGQPAKEKSAWVLLHEEYPGEVEPILGLARVMISEDDLDGALMTIEKALALSPADNRAQLVKGKILQRKDMTCDAIDVYSAILDSEPAHYEAAANLASALFKLERYDELLQRLEEALQHHPKQAVFSMFQFRTYVRLDRHEQALNKIDALLSRDTRSLKAEFYIEKTDLLMKLDRNDEADAVCESGIALFPENIKLLTLYARVGQRKLNAA